MKNLRYLLCVSLCGFVLIFSQCKKDPTEPTDPNNPNPPIDTNKVDPPDTNKVVKPIAQFSYILNDKTITFTNQSTGQLDTIQWFFGDGNESSNANPVHTYDTIGVFNIVLRVANAGGNDSDTQTVNIVSMARNLVIQDYNAMYLGSGLSQSELGWTGNVTGCDAGTVSALAHQKTLLRIQYFRKAAGLPYEDIQFRADWNVKAQEAALMSRANNSLSHNPPTSWICYTAAGKEGCEKSNLSMGSMGSDAVTAYIRDDGSGNFAVGHRRWLLFSRAKDMGHGSTSNTNAIWVIGGSGPMPTNLPEFIAWPPVGYIPVNVVFNRWSISKPSANFSSASVSMKDAEGLNVPLTLETVQNGFGDNTLVWVPQINRASINADTPFDVTVSNVLVGGNPVEFNYRVIIIKP